MFHTLNKLLLFIRHQGLLRMDLYGEIRHVLAT